MKAVWAAPRSGIHGILGSPGDPSVFGSTRAAGVPGVWTDDDTDVCTGVFLPGPSRVILNGVGLIPIPFKEESVADGVVATVLGTPAAAEATDVSGKLANSFTIDKMHIFFLIHHL